MTQHDDPKKSTHKPLMPFIILNNHLEMFGRVVDSTCKLSLAMLESTKKSEGKMAEAIAESSRITSVASEMIPSTDDVENAAAAVASAMNDAATRALSAISGADADQPEAPTADAVVTPIKKPTVTKTATKSKPSSPPAGKPSAPRKIGTRSPKSS